MSALADWPSVPSFFLPCLGKKVLFLTGPQLGQTPFHTPMGVRFHKKTRLSSILLFECLKDLSVLFHGLMRFLYQIHFLEALQRFPRRGPAHIKLLGHPRLTDFCVGPKNAAQNTILL
jgi:hypothetical protein